MISFLCPSWKRAYRIPIIYNYLKECSGHKNKIYFLVEQNDYESVDVSNSCMEATTVICTENKSTMAYKSGLEACLEDGNPYIVMIHDLTSIEPGAFDEALGLMDREKGVHVIGLDVVYPDKSPMPEGTLYMVRKEYIKTQSCVVDEPCAILNTKYGHYYSDTEFYYTAINRGVYKRVNSNKIRMIDDGGSSRNTRMAMKYLEDDKALYESRRGLFRGV